MANVRFSSLAEEDLFDIGSYTLAHWGQPQTIRYLSQLETCCQQLADNPSLGRSCEDIRPRLRRMEQGRHVIFYRQADGGGIIVSRILHQSTIPELHSIDEPEAIYTTYSAADKSDT